MSGRRVRPTIAISSLLALLVGVGAYLRMIELGALGFRWDEDLSALAVKAILETGVPELPSGMIYLRGTLHLYMMALCAKILGFGELALRVPAALFGIATIPLAFALGRALFDSRIGLLTAALLTISVWDIEFSRYARMYAPFTFFYVSTILAIWQYRIRTRSLPGGIACILLALVAISLHELGYTLVLALLLPLLVNGSASLRQPAEWAFALASAGIVAAFFFASGELVDYYRELPIAIAGLQGAPADVAVGTQSAWLVEVAAGALPDLPLLVALWARAPLVAAAFGGVLLGAAVLAGYRGAARPVARLLLVAIAICCALQLFNFALLGVLVLAFVRREGLAALRSAEMRIALGLIGVSLLAWVGLALGFGLLEEDGRGAAGGVRPIVRALLDYPRFFVFWGFPNEWPLLSIPATIGALWAFDRAARPQPERAALFALLVLATPLIANGLFDTLFELFRYNVPFNVFYFVLVALGLAHWPQVLAALRGASADPLGARAVLYGTAALAVCVLLFDLNPLRGWLAVQRDYQEDGFLYRAFGMQRYPDFKAPASFVVAHAEPTDAVLALDPREYFNYVGRLDYSVMNAQYESQTYIDPAGRRRDLYVATPLVMDLAELRAISETPGRVAWLIASDTMLDGTVNVTEDIKRFIQSQQRRVVYTGRDGVTKVYRFDAQTADCGYCLP